MKVRNNRVKPQESMEHRDTTKVEKIKLHNYYFHADEDFREDWEWNKNKTDPEIASKSIKLKM